MAKAQHAIEGAVKPLSLTVYSPSGVVMDRPRLTRAIKNLRALGFDANLDEAAKARHQRFAGDDGLRLEALHRVARSGSDIALASRGGYGLTRLLDAIDYKLIAKSIDRGTRWVGHSDQTALHAAILAHTGRSTWAGPMALDNFATVSDEAAIDDVTAGCFVEAMTGELEALGFQTEAGFDGLSCEGKLWGGNLTVLLSLLGTRHWPKVKGGILFLEDVNETPYRIERGLLQLRQAGVLDQQKAVVLGRFTGYRASPIDRGFKLPTVVQHVRSLTSAPVITGLPFGHIDTLVCVPVGKNVKLGVERSSAWMSWD